MDIVYRPSFNSDLDKIKKLLQQNNLPFDDISPNNAGFIVAIYFENIIGFCWTSNIR